MEIQTILRTNVQVQFYLFGDKGLSCFLLRKVIAFVEIVSVGQIPSLYPYVFTHSKKLAYNLIYIPIKGPSYFYRTVTALWTEYMRR